MPPEDVPNGTMAGDRLAGFLVAESQSPSFWNLHSVLVGGNGRS